jgi:putative spermidine/putrescine transport system permease protein
MPAVIAGGSVVFLVAFSEYFLVFLIGGGSVASFTGTLFPLLNSSNRSLAAILTLIFLCLPIVLFLVIDTILVRAYRKKGMI